MAEEVGGEGKEDTNVTVNCVHVIVHVHVHVYTCYTCIYIYMDDRKRPIQWNLFIRAP